MPKHEALIPKHGGYRKLKSFHIAQLIYDVTVRFCRRYVPRDSRTRDQMVQAARSGVQNIAEGSQASGTSKKAELKLTNVARASLEELRLDYEDFLRQRGLRLWDRDDPRRAQLIARRPATADDVGEWVGEVHGESSRSGEYGRSGRGGRDGRSAQGQDDRQSTPSTLSTPSVPSTPSILCKASTYAEIAANAALILIAVATGLLDRQLAAQAAAFETDGGFTERLYRTRHNRKGSE